MPTKDPALEKVRRRGLVDEAKRRQCNGADSDRLAKTLERVHAKFLFLGKHENAVQQFCRHFDMTPAHIQNNSWNALVVALELDPKIIGCVHNMKDVSYTERILRSFADKPDASIGRLIKAVAKIERLDAFTALQKDLEEIAEEHGELSQNEDSGFSSVDTESGNEPHMRMVYPDSSKIGHWWKKGLPFTLRHLEGDDRRVYERDRAKIREPSRALHVEENRVQGAVVSREHDVPTSCGAMRTEEPVCKVLITFAADGKSIATEVVNKLRAPNGPRPKIGVVLLDEHWEIVQRNPEKFIMHWFRRVNYVIPILTEGYLQSIHKNSSRTKLADTTETSLDVEYVPYIKDLADKYYTGNSCCNNKIRCIVPLNKRSILQRTQCKMDPLMKAFVYDTEIEKLARRMTDTYDV